MREGLIKSHTGWISPYKSDITLFTLSCFDWAGESQLGPDFGSDPDKAYGDYSLVVKLRFVEPVSRVRFSLVAPEERHIKKEPQK